MPGDEVLSTIAEVAIAFLGFTGVVGVFSGRDHPPAVAIRLWVMVEFGLALLLLALLPLVGYQLGWSGAPLWVVCGTATILFLVGHVALFVPPIVRHMRAGTWGEVPAILNLSFPLAYSACFVTQVLNLVGVGLDRSHGGYLLGLFFLLAASGLNFISLLVALRGSPAGQAV